MTRQAPVLSILGVVGVVAIAGCGSEKAPLPNGPDVRTCAGNWRVLLSPTEEPLYFEPRLDHLKWYQGRLYLTLDGYSRDGTITHGIFTLDPAGGSAPVQIQDADVLDFWFEDDRILFYASKAIYSMPLAGGPADLVLNSQIFDIVRFPLLDPVLDRQALYWSIERSDSAGNHQEIWREPRAGGGLTLLATLPVPVEGGLAGGLVAGLIPLPDRLVVLFQYGLEGRVWSVALDGGVVSDLPSVTGQLIGFAPDGTALWQHYSGGFNGTRGSDNYDIARTSADGAAAGPFWTSRPRGFYPMLATADGSGGFYVSSWQYAKDEALHADLWSVDASGNGKLVGCDPEVKGIVRVGAAAPGAFYGIVDYGRLYWNLVAVDVAAGQGAE